MIISIKGRGFINHGSTLNPEPETLNPLVFSVNLRAEALGKRGKLEEMKLSKKSEHLG